MSDCVNLQEARAVKQQDARLWSPVDCLKAVLRDLENGEMKPVDVIYIAMVRKDEAGQASAFPFYTAGGTTLELRGVLTQHISDMCAGFRRD